MTPEQQRYAEAKLSRLFAEYANTLRPSIHDWYFDPRNSDDYLRGFSEWLRHYRPEFASND